MKRLIPLLLISLIMGMAAAPLSASAADENSRELAAALSRLKEIPRYQGRILGTHIRRDNGHYLYEVRILRRDDRIVLVYIDPETGNIVSDSERSNGRNVTKRKKRK